ncbi:metallophosphoesterase family protein [Desulfurococcaceae archaeon MEX13E-LK6-19]|nr:metallophosphoesterase family protein [Desulfurococcaceae archaeon MEX13E-LK6-19]
MRVFAVADIHCSYTYTIKAVYKAVETSSDMILLAGDIECSDIIDEFVDTGIRVYGVTGNLDDNYIYRYMRSKGILLDGVVEEYRGCLIAGIGGLSLSLNLNKIKEKLGPSPSKPLIVLSHYPAHGYNDKTFTGEHAGLIELKNFIDEYKPILFVHGHIHEARGVSRHDKTVIVNPGPLMHGYYSVIDISDSGVEARLERL